MDLRGADLRGVRLGDLPLACLSGGLAEDEWHWQDVTEGQAKLAAILMNDADLSKARLEGAHLSRAHLEGVHLLEAHLEVADLSRACLEGAYMRGVHLEKTDLGGTNFSGANLLNAQLERSDLFRTQLEGAYLADIKLIDKNHVGLQLADTQWSNTNPADIDWTSMKMLGDEYKAHRTKKLEDYHSAVRANRQLVIH